MKKILALVLALALCLALCACGQETAGDPAATEGPRSDVSVTPIPKPGEGDGGKTDTPAAPAATEKPAPPDIYVTDLCDVTGALTYQQGYRDYFSFTLPKINGVHTDYVQAANSEIERIYNAMVAPSLKAMQEPDGYPESYCAAYTHAETDGVHSLLITCDSDWGEDYYWCYNFDEYGEEADNASLLALVGLTPEQFVKTARDYLTEATDLSAYFEDDGWKELQEQTIADDNCNADMPMAILPDGNLCFIATVYTPAGAGEYDCALELFDDGSVGDVNLGRIAVKQLRDTYLVDGQELGGDENISYMLEFFSVGDTLTAEVAVVDTEVGSIYSYYAADIIPEDPADLLAADGRPVSVRVLPYSPDVFDGSYYGEAGLYTMTIDGDSVTFSDYWGGTVFIAEEFTAHSRYDLEDLDDAYPETDYEHFDYDTVEASGIAGVWTGYYTDTGFKVHSLTLELTNYGGLWLRDCAEGEIPRVMGGSYYIAGADDDFAEEEGMVVFNLVTVGGYKMPYMGACQIFVDEDGCLEVYDTEEEYSMSMLLRPTEYICCMDRVPQVSMTTWYRSITPLEEGDTYTADVWGTGENTEYSYTLVRDENAGGAITGIDFSLNGEETSLDDLWIYDAQVFVIEPGRTGNVYFYVDGLSDNDYHYTDIIAADDEDFWYAGYYNGGPEEDPWDPECFVMYSRCSMLSTVTIYRSYRVGLGGLPEPIDPFFFTDSDLTLTALHDIDAWKADSETGEIYYDVVLPAGTELTLLRTDGHSFWDLVGDDGECYRVWVDASEGWPQTIGGENITDCFDGLMFAG